jgi:hypothetical protein
MFTGSAEAGAAASTAIMATSKARKRILKAGIANPYPRKTHVHLPNIGLIARD